MPPSRASDFSHGRSFARHAGFGRYLSGTLRREQDAFPERPRPRCATVQKVVDEVADEVFCWLPTISASKGVPSLIGTQDVLSETFEQRDALSFQNEYSDEVCGARWENWGRWR